MALAYDAMGRLQQEQVTAGTACPSTPTAGTVFVYSGSRLSAEYNAATGALVRRYVHGSGTDEPVVSYDYSGGGAPVQTWFHADERGSIVATSDPTGNNVQTYAYGPFRESQTAGSLWASSRFGYTGQVVIPEARLYYYKARFYDPVSGHFIHPDPSGYQGGVNLYAYALGDPANYTDPTGKSASRLGNTRPMTAADYADLSGKQIIDMSQVTQNGQTFWVMSSTPSTAVTLAASSAPAPDLVLQASIDLVVSETQTLALSAELAAEEAGAAAGGGLTRVGRWMSQGEFDAMSDTGLVQEGAGGRTYVVNPANPAAYQSAAPGSVYSEFNVPTDSLFPAGKPEWSVIPGPNVTTRLYGPAPTSMPPATCIVCVIGGGSP